MLQRGLLLRGNLLVSNDRPDELSFLRSQDVYEFYQSTERDCVLRSHSRFSPEADAPRFAQQFRHARVEKLRETPVSGEKGCAFRQSLLCIRLDLAAKKNLRKKILKLFFKPRSAKVKERGLVILPRSFFWSNVFPIPCEPTPNRVGPCQ